MRTISYFAVVMLHAVRAIVYRPANEVPTSEYKINRTNFPMAFPYPMGSPGCGATMISKQHAITAAHCLEAGEFEPFKLELSNGDVHTVVERRPNDCYDLKTGLPNPADVAILVLDEPINS